MIKTAVIMAAGLGTRFGKRTESIPKSFIEVNGKSMIIREIEILLGTGIKKIIIGTGYKKEMFEQLKERYPQIECCYSEYYASTNSMWTLYNCREVIGNDDFILLESDLVFERKAITALMNDSHPDILLATNENKFQDQYFVEYNQGGFLTHCSVNRQELNVCGELVGIHKISNPFYKDLCDYYLSIKQDYPKMGYEFALLHLSKIAKPIYVLKIDGLKWYEIDDERDLSYAETIDDIFTKKFHELSKK